MKTKRQIRKKDEWTNMRKEDCIIIGGGPCGLAAAISLQEIGKHPLILEKGNVVNAIYRYPTHQTFSVQATGLQLVMCRLLPKI